MEKLEIVIAVLLLCLVALGVYVTTYWTLSRKRRRDAEDDPRKTEVQYRYLEEKAENERKKVATAYAQETMPRITITPVQPRPNFPRVRPILLSNRPLHSRTITFTSTRFEQKFFPLILKNTTRKASCYVFHQKSLQGYCYGRRLTPLWSQNDKTFNNW